MNQNRMAFLGGKVLTVNSYDDIAEAALIEGERIVAVGTSEEIKRMTSDDTKIFNLRGRSLIPGFIDAHNHFTLEGASLRSASFGFPGVSSIKDLVEVVKKEIASKPKGQYVRGWGMDWGKFSDGRLPNRQDIDAVSPDHPVCIVHYTGHHVLVNSLALKIAGVDRNTPDPLGGRLVRDDNGVPTGLALDAAQQLVVPSTVKVGHHGPDIGYDTAVDELTADISKASDEFLKVGLTTVVDPQVTTREMVGYMEARRRGQLGVRTVCMLLSNHLGAVKELGLVDRFGDDRLSLGPIKYYCDGTLVGGTAAFSLGYENNPNFFGSFYWDLNELKDSLIDTHKMGLQFGIHCQGDRAIGAVLDIVEEALSLYPRPDHRHRIEHFGGATPEQVKITTERGVIPITQPGQLYEACDNLYANYGEERAKFLYPLRALFDAGSPAVISSDAFVQSYKPFDTISSAVNRIGYNGLDMGSEQRITIMEAIRGHTINAARSVFMEDRLGSIEPGKLADIVVLDQDLTACAPADIAQVKVDLTILGGEIKYLSRE